MKNLVKIAFCLMAVLFAFNAEAKIEKSELLGTWTQTVNEGGVMVITTYDFMEDDNVKQMLIMNSASPKMNIIADGTAQYKLDDDSIIFKFSGKDFNFTAFEIEGLPEEMKGMAQQQMMQQLVNVEQKITDVKIDGNTLTAKFNNETITLTRN